MPCLLNLVDLRNSWYKSTFRKCGLRERLIESGDKATVIHCWVPERPDPQKPNLLLLHGVGVNALWQWGDVISDFVGTHNVHVPDLLFFGESHTKLPHRDERFHGACIAEALASIGVTSVAAAFGMSYGGFVAYAMAAGAGPVGIDRVLICSAGVSLEEEDIANRGLSVSNAEEAARILVPLTPPKLKELVYYTFHLQPPVCLIPDCLLGDFIDAMCRDNAQEKKELILSVAKGRQLSNLPIISQPTWILWGDKDKIFPIELAYRLQRHLGSNAQVFVIKNAGHALNVEKPREFLAILKSFLNI